MKPFLRGFIFTYIGVVFSQQFFRTFVFLDSKSFWMIVLAFTLLNIFKASILALVSIPSKGVLFHIFSIFMSCVLLNILVAIIPQFRLMASSTPDFNIFGNMIRSIYMPAFFNGIASAVTISLSYNFLTWLGSKK
jgi:hypothetical protein